MSASRNSTRIALISAAVLLLAGAAGGYWMARQPQSDQRKVLYWHDPMVPNARFDKPGKSPFMDMQLVPVYADEVGAQSMVSVAAHVAQSLGIRVGKAEKINIQPRFTAVGAVAFNEQLVDVLAARAEGVVTRLLVHAPFETVRRGQALVQITSPAWIEAQQEYLSMLDAQSEVGRALRAAARERLGVMGIPAATILDVESKRVVSSVVTLYAPNDGVINELNVREGSAIVSGMPLMRINGLESVWVNARIPEAQRALAMEGSQVEAVAVAWPGAVFPGKVIAIQSQVEAESRAITARVLLQNADRRLVPGMFVSINIRGADLGPRLVVPDEAVIATGERQVVITTDGKDQFSVTKVTTGASQDGRTVILDGLQEGQDIVFSGQFLIDSEASLKSAISRLEHGP